MSIESARALLTEQEGDCDFISNAEKQVLLEELRLAVDVVEAAEALYARRKENDRRELEYWMVTPSSYLALLKTLDAFETAP